MEQGARGEARSNKLGRVAIALLGVKILVALATIFLLAELRSDLAHQAVSKTLAVSKGTWSAGLDATN